MKLLSEFSLQLFSIRDDMEKDFIGSLEKVSEIGYTGVEFAGYGDIKADDMKKLLKELNLKPVGSHISPEVLKDSLEQELEYSKIIDTEYLVCPYLPMETEEDAIKMGEFLKDVAEKVTDAGFKFAYHNHAHEFSKTADGKYFMDVILEMIPEDNMFLELDMYWAAYAGVDYMEYLEQHKDRIKMIHVKQIENLETKKDVDVAAGIIDFKEVINVGLENGVEHFILEREEYDTTPFDAIESGYKYISSL